MIESGEIYKLIVENVNDLVAVINQDIIYEYMNENVHEKLTGYSSDDLLGKKVLNFVHIEDHKKVFNEFDKSLETGIRFTEIRFKHKEGHFIWIETNGKQFIDKDGKIKVLTISRDITERKIAEDKLKYSEEKYHGLFNSFPYFIGLIDIEGTLLYCNPAANNFLSRHTREDIIGLNVFRILSILEENKKLIPPFKRLLKETISDGKFKIFEFKLHRSKGGFLWLRIEGSPVKIGAKKLIQFIIQDITERKSTEEKLKKSEFKLQERVKELGSIYKLSKLIENPNTNIENIFQGTLALISSAFQFPNIICARILYKNKVYSTINFEITDWKFSTKGMINQNEMIIEICYLEEKTFTKGEHDLIGDFFLRLKSSIEEREAKKKLKESEEKYRIISETAYDLIIVLNQKFEYEYINENAHQHILGYSKEDLLGKSALKYAHPDDVPNTTRILFDGFNRGRGEAEFRLKHKDGHWLWLEGKGKTFSDNDGDLKAIIISRDITERKLMEQKLKDSEERYRLISESANDLIRVLNDRFEFEYINENVHKRLLGYTKEDLLGEAHLPFFHPEDRRHAIRSTMRNLKKGEGSYQARFKDKNGNYRWFEFAGKYFFDSKGKKKILSIARDINERRLAEEKLKESEEKYRLITENINDAIYVLNEKFEFEYVNASVHERLMGYSENDLIGRSSINFVHPEDVKKSMRALRNVTKGGMGKEGMEVIRIRDKKNIYHWLEIRGRTFIDGDNKLKALLVARDVTDRIIADQKLKKSEDKYRKAYNRANFYKDIFGHDINNILHIISSSAELISYHLGGSEKSKVIEDISNIIKNQVERGAKLVANISILSQLEEDDMQTQPTDVCRLMRNSIDFINNAYNDKEIKINDACEKDHLTANANELLQDVFDNILINSIKYNEHPNIEISIKASKILVDDTNFIKMEFSDNGIGVPDDRKEIVFKRGNRELKGSKGMGIGLSLVKKIMKGYNGKIWVEDKVKGDYSQGSNFILLIPEII